MTLKPPKRDENAVANLLDSDSKALLQKYLAWNKPVDNKGRYLPFSEFKYRVPEDIDAKTAWQFTRMARNAMSTTVIKLGEPLTAATLYLTPTIQRAISCVDQHTTEPMLNWVNSQIGEKRNLEFLFNDLVEDETISSSQLEGAATTTLAAKELLKTKREPRTLDERMIVGNFKMMLCAWENRHKPLSCDLIQELHHTGVEGIDDAQYQPGHLRTNNKVVITDADDEVVHRPPTFEGLRQRLEQLSDWVNTEGDLNGQYIHPLVKAIILHFTIGYEHPFYDGNGRVARALFYWFMFKHGFPAFRYITISTLLKKAPVKYGKSYLYTEHDELDLTYFVDYQCSIIIRAIERFVETYQSAIKKINAFDTYLYESGLFGKLSDNERVIFQVAHAGVATHFTTNNVAQNLKRSYNTAATALNNLVKHKLFVKNKVGREWVYEMKSLDEIMRGWKK